MSLRARPRVKPFVTPLIESYQAFCTGTALSLHLADNREVTNQLRATQR